MALAGLAGLDRRSTSRTTAAGRRASTAASARAWTPRSRSARPARKLLPLTPVERRSAGARSMSNETENQPGGQAPVVQRLRIRYAKRGRLRFTSHRDFARAFERALRRAGVPIAYSQGFTPHPKISYASAAPTGVASEAEYLEIGLRAAASTRPSCADALDAALLAGPGRARGRGRRRAAACPTGSTRRRGGSSCPGSSRRPRRRRWRRSWPRRRCRSSASTKQGRRRLDARSAGGPVRRVAPGHGTAPSEVSRRTVCDTGPGRTAGHPAVRPDDVLSGLRVVADLEPPVPPRATRLAQGTLDRREDELVDPLAADRSRWASSELRCAAGRGWQTSAVCPDSPDGPPAAHTVPLRGSVRTRPGASELETAHMLDNEPGEANSSAPATTGTDTGDRRRRREVLRTRPHAAPRRAGPADRSAARPPADDRPPERRDASPPADTDAADADTAPRPAAAVERAAERRRAPPSPARRAAADAAPSRARRPPRASPAGAAAGPVDSAAPQPR